MNGIDLLVGLVAAAAVYTGWRRGFILQLFSLAGIIGGAWLAARFGRCVGVYLHLDPSVATAGGFLLVFVGALLGLALLGQFVRKIFHFAGFGIIDTVLGIGVALLKGLLILSVLFSTFGRMNQNYTLMSKESIERSITFAPVCRISAVLLPFIDRQITQLTDQHDRE
ncbi:MAG: CvpA family protein [Alistipes sp.]